MDNIAGVSQSVLRHRRKKMRRHRRQKAIAVIWQTLVVSGLVGGLLWAIAQPFSAIASKKQINVQGNQFLSEKTIVSSLEIEYPQSLWKIEPKAIAKNLESQAPIAKATITRQLFPPNLTVTIIERHPVAISQPSSTLQANEQQEAGWLDAEGNWIPLETYSHLQNSKSLPTLRAIGPLRRYRQYWHQIYKTLSRSPVKVFEIDWQDPGNLILTTELGIVHLGPLSSKLNEQLLALDRMRQLPEKLGSQQMAYIDLKNPQSPSVQLSPQRK